MRLCSSDPNLQRALIQAQNKEALNRYQKFKDDYDKTMRDRNESSLNRADQLANNLSSVQNPDFESAQKVLQDHIEEWNKETERVSREEASREANSEKNEGKSPEQLLKDAEEASEEKRTDEKLANVPDNVVGSLASSVKGLDRRMGEIERQERDLMREYRQIYPDDAEGLAGMEQVIGANRLLRREVFHGGTFEKMGELFLKAAESFAPSYVTSALKLCDVISSRKYCIFRELTPEERREAACTLIVQNLPMWKGFKHWAEKYAQSLNEKAAIEATNEGSSGGICKSVLPKEKTGAKQE